jgi:hypothetical protein
LNISWLDEQETKGIVKEILNKMDARNCSYSLDLVAIICRSSQIVIGEEVPQKLKGWLSPPDPSTNYNIGLRDLHKETATWFLEGCIFQEWHSSGSLLWIHGKRTYLKTYALLALTAPAIHSRFGEEHPLVRHFYGLSLHRSLTSLTSSAIIQHILSLSDGGRAFVGYFYFDFRDDNKKHRHDLLPSLLIQFAAHSIPCCDIISRVYLSHGKGTQRPTDEVLINCLMNMLSVTTHNPIYIIVDALDECPNNSGVRSPRERVLSLIKDLVDLRLPNLHICVTSRPEIDIRIRLEPLTSHHISLHNQARHKEDIAKYIRSEVDFIANDKRWRENDKELVMETLSEKADGM